MTRVKAAIIAEHGEAEDDEEEPELGGARSGLQVRVLIIALIALIIAAAAAGAPGEPPPPRESSTLDTLS